MRNIKMFTVAALAVGAFGALSACSNGEAVSSAKVAVTSSAPSTAPAAAAPSSATPPPPASATAANQTQGNQAQPAPAAPAASSAAPAPKPVAAPQKQLGVAANPKLGTIVTDGAGLTVYRLDGDAVQKSNCAGDCAKRFPPVLVPTDGIVRVDGIDPTLIGKLARPDGTTQVTLAGRPIYRYAGDTAPGDTAGQGFGGGSAITATGAKAVARKA